MECISNELGKGYCGLCRLFANRYCIVTIHASLMFPADQVLPYMVRNTYWLPPTLFRTPPGTPSRIGPTHPASVTSVPDPRISTLDTAPCISHDHCAPFIGMGLYAYLLTLAIHHTTPGNVALHLVPISIVCSGSALPPDLLQYFLDLQYKRTLVK